MFSFVDILESGWKSGNTAAVFSLQINPCVFYISGHSANKKSGRMRIITYNAMIAVLVSASYGDGLGTELTPELVPCGATLSYFTVSVPFVTWYTGPNVSQITY